METGGFLRGLLLLGLFLGGSHGEQCSFTSWSDEITPCPDDKVEIYRNQDKTSNQYSSKCCVPNTEDEKNARLYAAVCQQSLCVPTDLYGKYDLCTETNAIPNRLFIEDQEIKYVEAVTDACMGAGEDGVVGVELLCCPANSTDLLLTTLYGVEKFEFPHFVRMGTGGCGGTVYNKRWVITASHCVTDEKQHVINSTDSDWEDCCGTVRINVEINDAYTENTYKVKRIVVHPESSRLKPLDEQGRLYNDIALLELESDIQFNDKVKALKIPDKGYNPLEYGDQAVIVGFGLSDALTYSKKLQKANLPIRAKDKVLAEGMLGFMKQYKEQLMFVGGIFDGDVQPSAGTGDSGGPAICRDSRGNVILCGVTSFTAPISTCKEKLDGAHCPPAVYVDVQYFSEWIRSVAGDQSDAELLEQPLYGNPVPKGEYSGHVHITSKEGRSCGGTLIGEDLVVTAASCVAEDDGTLRNVKVNVGSTDLDQPGKNTFNAKAIVLMDGFKRADEERRRRKRVISLVLESWQQGKLNDTAIMKDPFYHNNLAVVKLSGSSGVQPLAPLQATLPPEGSPATEVAFPASSSGGRPLSKRQFKILSHSDCQRRMDRLSPLGYNVKVDDNLLCGVEKYSGGSLCDRELGGGLFCEGGEKAPVLCGVQVFRTCEFAVPNAFIDVSSVKDWLDAAVTALKDA